MSFYADAPAELLYNLPGVGNAVTNTVTSGAASGGPLLGGGPTAGVASVIPPCEIPHGYFSKIGKAIMIEGFGVYSLGSTVPTMKIAFYLDAVPGTPVTLLCATGAFTADTTSRAAMGFNFKVMLTCTALGTPGALQAWGWLNWGMVPSLTTTVAAPQITYVIGPATTAPVAFTTVQTAPTYLDVYASWSTSSTGPSITLTQMMVWGLNLSAYFNWACVMMRAWNQGHVQCPSAIGSITPRACVNRTTIGAPAVRRWSRPLRSPSGCVCQEGRALLRSARTPNARTAGRACAHPATQCSGCARIPRRTAGTRG